MATTAFDAAAARAGTTASVYYAGKALLTTAVARWVTEAGLGIDVCSGGELAVVEAAGVDPRRVGLHGNNKSLSEIDRAVGLYYGAREEWNELAKRDMECDFSWQQPAAEYMQLYTELRSK